MPDLSYFRYTMTKSTTIIFILFFAILFGLEKKVISINGMKTFQMGYLFCFFFLLKTELVSNGDCCINIIGTMYVHL